MTNTPDGNTLPEAPVGHRSRPSDVVANPPVAKLPAAEVGAQAGPARPGTVPADNPALALERAARVNVNMGEAVTGQVLSTDQIMPTCMVYSMFAVLILLLLVLGFWMIGAVAGMHLIQ